MRCARQHFLHDYVLMLQILVLWLLRNENIKVSHAGSSDPQNRARANRAPVATGRFQPQCSAQQRREACCFAERRPPSVPRGADALLLAVKTRGFTSLDSPASPLSGSRYSNANSISIVPFRENCRSDRNWGQVPALLGIR